MKNNDIFFDENIKYNENKLNVKIKSNSNNNNKYQNIFLCPLNKNDCVNSIDIYDDIILYGTIMGNVYLCRVNQNNLFMNKKQDLSNNKNISLEINNSKISNKNDVQYEMKLKYKFDDKDTSKISCIKLNTNNNLDNNSINNIQNNGSETLRTNNNDNNNNNNEKLFYDDSDIMPSNNALKNIKNQKKKLININILENKNNKSDKSIIEKESIVKIGSNESIPFPQITQLILNATENVPCVSFDTKDKVNLSIGDYEIIRLENMSSFNINDDNSNYNYIRIRNYSSENEHIKSCENSTCMMTDKNFLLVHTDFAENNTSIFLNEVNYENKVLSSLEVIKGEIKMYNYSIPFDFDGDKFLFLDYESDSIRRICIYYTLSKKPCYIYKITKDFGHISYMKLLLNDKIFLCKNHKFCEIHKIEENFRLLESWEHDGNEIIAMNVYIEGSKDSVLYIEESYTNLSIKKNNENDSQTIEVNLKMNSKNKFNDKSGSSNNIKNNIQGRQLYDKDKDRFNNSTMRELKSSNRKIKQKNIDIEDIYSDKYLDINFNSNIENRKNKFEKEDIVVIYNKYKTPSMKDKGSINEYKKKKLSIYNKEDSHYFQMSGKELIDKKRSISHYIQKKNQATERSFYQNEKKIYIITVDLNGNVNLYHKKERKTIFNLYNISNIDKKYKEAEFFALGFPYYVTMNSNYIAISTDHGIFVLSNKI